MYRIDDTVAAINAVQRMLGINASGKYDGTTVAAVKRIQKIYGFEGTGVTDYATFVAIAQEYRRRKAGEWNNSYLFAPKFPYSEGDVGDNVGRINEALSVVLKSYRYEGTLPRGKYLSADAVKGAQFLMDTFGIRKNDVIDAAFMNRLLNEISGIVLKEKFGL